MQATILSENVFIAVDVLVPTVGAVKGRLSGTFTRPFHDDAGAHANELRSGCGGAASKSRPVAYVDRRHRRLTAGGAPLKNKPGLAPVLRLVHARIGRAIGDRCVHSPLELDLSA